MIHELKAVLGSTACITTYDPHLHPVLSYHHNVENLSFRYKELRQWFPVLSPKSNPDQQDQYFTMRIAHSVLRETVNENYPFDLLWSNDFTSRIMPQQLQHP